MTDLNADCRTFALHEGDQRPEALGLLIVPDAEVILVDQSHRFDRRYLDKDQTEAAQRMGVKQQTISALERNAETVSAERLLRLLNVLGVELVMRKADPGSVDQGGKSKPAW